MKALVLEEYDRLVYMDVPQPEVGPEDVLIAVNACGICGSDVHGLDRSSGRRVPPIIMGHEASGVIAETGTKVRGWKQGDRVTFDSTVYCGRCYFCRRGEINLCDHRMVLGVSCDDYRRHGAFAEYVVVPDRILYALPDELTFEQAAMIEPLSVAVHAVARTPLRINDCVVVVGAGMIGLLLIQVLRAVGCGLIIAVDLDRARLRFAEQCGADVALPADDCDVVGEVRCRSEGRGSDAAFEVAGAAGAFDIAVRSLRKGGFLTLVGNLAVSVELPLQQVVVGEVSLHGSCNSRGEYPACIAMITRGMINLIPLISAVAPLAEGAAWFARLYRKEPGLLKVILRP